MKIQLEVFSTTKAQKRVNTWLIATVDSRELRKYFYGDLFSDSWLSNNGANCSIQDWIKVTARTLHELGRYFRYEEDYDSLYRIMQLFYDKAQHKLIYMTVKAM